MGAWNRYACDNCGYSVDTSGPWEFYRDSDGTQKRYGHPVPASDEAYRRGIYGLSANVYCAQCDTVSDVNLVEYKQPTHDTLGIWAGRIERMAQYETECAVKCPKCGNSNLVLDPEEIEKIPCPRCKEGILIGKMVVIS